MISLFEKNRKSLQKETVSYGGRHKFTKTS